MKSGGEQHRMDELKQIGEMIYSNVQWIFSGIGVAVISILGGKAAVKKVKRKQKAKMHDRLHWMFLKPIRQYTQKLPKKQLMKELLILQMIFLQ